MRHLKLKHAKSSSLIKKLNVKIKIGYCTNVEGDLSKTDIVFWFHLVSGTKCPFEYSMGVLKCSKTLQAKTFNETVVSKAI